MLDNVLFQKESGSCCVPGVSSSWGVGREQTADSGKEFWVVACGEASGPSFSFVELHGTARHVKHTHSNTSNGTAEIKV